VTARIKSSRPSEHELLAAARRGEETALSHLLETHRADLRAHCYLMLGSPHDADDAMQDALLRAWRGLPGFQGRSAFRSWLHRIATNACLDLIKRRPTQVLPIGHRGHARDVVTDDPPRRSPWPEPYPNVENGSGSGHASPEATYERREAFKLALIATLHHLPPRQRAVLILRDVLGFSAKEASRTLGTTLASVNSALQRARQRIHARLLDQDQLASLRPLVGRGTREIVERLVDAFEATDVNAVVSLLAEDVAFHDSLGERESIAHTARITRDLGREGRDEHAESSSSTTSRVSAADVAMARVRTRTEATLPSQLNMRRFYEPKEGHAEVR
jgi:RNA polymerase sigma-70 factor (ECF subfamily)